MKRIPSLLLAGLLLGSGCYQMGGPRSLTRQGPGLYDTQLGTPVNPTRVTPRTEDSAKPIPTQVDRPAVPEQAPEKAAPATDFETPALKNQDAETSPAKPPAPEDSESVTPAETDAAPWLPLLAPEKVEDEVPSARKDATPLLGKSAPLPSQNQDRTQLSEVSRSQPVSTQSADVKWVDVAQSTGQRAIQMLESGSKDQAILIVGSLYGNEPESIALIDETVSDGRLTSHVTERLIFLRTANPDGLAERIRTNQQGVDLNRNFPSTNFTANPSQQTGPHPASEVETQAMVKLLRNLNPMRVVHVRSAVGSRPLVLVNPLLRAKIGQTPLPQNVDLETIDGTFKAGSLEEFVSVRMNVEMMTILLPPDGFDTLTPAQFVDLVRIGLGSASVQDSLVQSNVAAPVPATAPPSATVPAQPVKAESSDEESIAPGAKGYVEFLPPPPESGKEDPRESRFYELPPPE